MQISFAFILHICRLQAQHFPSCLMNSAWFLPGVVEVSSSFYFKVQLEE